MHTPLELAHGRLLAPGEITDRAVESVLDSLLTRRIDYADLYFQQTRRESWSLEDGIVRDGGYALDRGVGVRAVSGEKTGFAYADEIVLPALREAAHTSRAIAQSGGDATVALRRRDDGRSLYAPIDPLETLSADAKVALLHALDAEARRQDPRVIQVTASISGVQDILLVAASDGGMSADVRPLVRINVSVIVEQGGRRESGASGMGGRFAYAQLLEDEQHLGVAREAVRLALVNLRANEAPAGQMDVVLGPGWPGVLLHEAVGHGLEGDFNRKGVSAFSGRIGERVASPLCTVVDDGTLAMRRGSLNIDDEGTPSQRNVLIEKGRLRGYLQDKTNARLMGAAATGNGRRESYHCLPMPRMTNTFMLAGESDPGEIIASVERGLYAVNFGGGQVDITSGKFVFSTSEAYLIEKGKVTRPVKGAMLIGSGPEAMQRIALVGNDLQLDPGVGVCGKEGQSVPVGVGQPTLLIKGLTVGGTQQEPAAEG